MIPISDENPARLRPYVTWLLVLAWWVVSTGLVANDWAYIAGVDPQSPYANRVFRWSVPAAWLWAVVVVPLGPLLWGTLHLVALATIRNLGVVLLAVVTYPFWWDVANGNVLTFAFVLGWHALAGRRVGVIGYALFAALVPRPLMIPVLTWLLVRYPSARWAFAAGIVGDQHFARARDDDLVALRQTLGREPRREPARAASDLGVRERPRAVAVVVDEEVAARAREVVEEVDQGVAPHP